MRVDVIADDGVEDLVADIGLEGFVIGGRASASRSR
jgi:hypothetical protein